MNRSGMEKLPRHTTIVDVGRYCTLPRRMAAIFYDGLLLIALWMAAAAVVVIVLQREVSPSNPWFQVYLLTLTWAYFAVCWRGGQTLGMKAWRISIVGKTRPLPWMDTLIRFATSILSWVCFGLGYFWSLGHPQRAAWHDLASDTRLVVTPRRPAGADSTAADDSRGSS